ncbi:hypothetical protein NM208_g2392 [Fusarium decemcellulare]|uniref:Uncharacterized protein n=1 Tax=Fusarium decemcellulare TaxID=57161 RepID=A0ACC1SSL7_9HYPO|nr:hypothetical protein NM208_g2392 [Fusarium decemcellulare]
MLSRHRQAKADLVDESPLRSRDRSVSRRFVHRLQQRIETLEALNHGGAAASNTGSSHDQDEGVDPAPADPMLPDALRYLCCLHDQYSTTSPGQRCRRAGPTENASISNTQPQPQLVSAAANRSSPDAPRGLSPSFYGATSHPHVVSPSDESESLVIGGDDGDAVNIDLDPTSTHLRDHLFQSFFKYQTLWVDVVDKKTFLAHQANGHDSRWYSRFLENAMLACGTRLSTSKSVRALGAMFCAKAKDQVLVALSEPTPANLQGFMLLSEYEVTQGNNRPGWMFCGKCVACRMLSDLGLHELASSPTTTRGEADESDLAYALLSACFVYEGVWTLYLGRPSCIPRSFVSVVDSRCREGRRSDSPWLNAWVGLCVPMDEITHALNDQSLSKAARCDLLRKLFKRVQEWYDKLPPELAYNENRLTSMDLAGYGLHTQFCKVQILIRRALSNSYNPRKRQHSQMICGENTGEPPDHSQAIIYQYALRIARLVVTYREVFGLEKIPSIVLDNAVVAATVMVQHLNKAENEQDRQNQMVWLRQLVKSMEAVQPHFPIVGRMLDSLKHICGKGAVSDIFTPGRRASTNAASLYDPPAPGLSVDLNSGASKTQQFSMELGISPDITWEGFDLDGALGVFSPGGFDESMMHLPLPEALMPVLAQMPHG